MDLVAASPFLGRFCRPRYNDLSFGRLPGTIERLLLGTPLSPALPSSVTAPLVAPYDTVVLFLVDSLGWRMLQESRTREPLVDALCNAGHLTKLTSLFPSATSVHVPYLHSGVPLVESGVLEWMYYESRLERYVSPLIFSRAEDAAEAPFRKRNSLLEENIDAGSFLPSSQFYPRLRDNGVKSAALMSEGYATRSPFTRRVITPDQIYPFTTLTEGLETLSHLLSSPVTGPQYISFYYDTIDSTSHRFGPDAPETMAAIAAFFHEIDIFLSRASASRTLCLFVADHGQMRIDPTRTVYLDEEFPALHESLPRHLTPFGLIPSGALRNLFLHVEESKLPSFMNTVTERLEGIAEVVPTSLLVEEGIFGDKMPSPVFRENIGNVTILPYEHESVWLMGNSGRFRSKKLGAHGGLSADEIEIPLLALEL